MLHPCLRGVIPRAGLLRSLVRAPVCTRVRAHAARHVEKRVLAKFRLLLVNVPTPLAGYRPGGG